MLRERMLSRTRLLVIRERRVSVKLQVANQQKIEKTSTRLVSRIFSQVEEKWSQMGIFKYKFLKIPNVKKIDRKLCDKPGIMTNRQGRTNISSQ